MSARPALTRAFKTLDALKLILDDAGASPLNADQLPQIESLYARPPAAR